jgi:adenosylcobinamide-GDP ribazoletransferase
MALISGTWRALAAAVRFLTILPVPRAKQLPESDSDWGRATAWYPAVGLILGLVLAALDLGLRWLWPEAVATALLLLAWVLLTGALHLDGLADCCDALLAPLPAGRRLEILRDVHAGTFGIVGLILVLLVKVAALGAVPGGIRFPVLLLIPTLARWAMTGVVLLYPYARSGPGLGQRARAGAGAMQLAIASGTALLVCALASVLGLSWTALLLVAVTALTAFLVAQWIQSKIGGLTGDGYGAICELAETAALLAVAALVYRGLLL